MSISISCPKGMQFGCTWPNCRCFTGGPLPSPLTQWVVNSQPMGCICPPGSEATCKGVACPRREAVKT